MPGQPLQEERPLCQAKQHLLVKLEFFNFLSRFTVLHKVCTACLAEPLKEGKYTPQEISCLLRTSAVTDCNLIIKASEKLPKLTERERRGREQGAQGSYLNATRHMQTCQSRPWIYNIHPQRPPHMYTLFYTSYQCSFFVSLSLSLLSRIKTRRAGMCCLLQRSDWLKMGSAPLHMR